MLAFCDVSNIVSMSDRTPVSMALCVLRLGVEMTSSYGGLLQIQ
jgi:hypothetical protein